MLKGEEETWRDQSVFLELVEKTQKMEEEMEFLPWEVG